MIRFDVVSCRHPSARRAAAWAATAALFAFPGCAWFRTLSRADEEPRPQPWSLQCFWVDRTTDATDPVGPRDHGDVLGEDPNGRRVVFSGALEDGFLRVDETDAWTEERGRAPLGVEGSPEALERACRETLSRKQPGAGVEIARVARGIGDQVRRLHAAGGRRFVVINLPDLGRTPGVLHNESYRQDDEENVSRRATLSRKLSELSRHHNHELHEEIARLRTQFPGTPIVEIDAAQSFQLLLTRRSPVPGRWRFDYGFDTRARESRELRDRRGRIRIQDKCYAGGYLGTSDPENICVEESQTFFWDSVHPTSFTHCWLAYFIGRDLARAGLLEIEPDPWTHRDYCESRARTSRVAPG